MAIGGMTGKGRQTGASEAAEAALGVLEDDSCRERRRVGMGEIRTPALLLPLARGILPPAEPRRYLCYSWSCLHLPVQVVSSVGLYRTSRLPNPFSASRHEYLQQRRSFPDGRRGRRNTLRDAYSALSSWTSFLNSCPTGRPSLANFLRFSRGLHCISDVSSTLSILFSYLFQT